MKKLKLLFAACTLLFGATANAQTDVTASYIGNVDRIIQGGGHNCSANKHVLSKAGGSQGEGYFNTQDLGNGWHNFVANTKNVTNGVESWTGSAGSEGWILGRVMVLPQGQYTLKFTAMSTNQSGALTNTVVKCGNEEKAFVGQGTYDEYSFDIDVTTANTPYEFGIYQKSGGTGNWSVMGGISLTLNSTNVFPVDNSNIASFIYSGNQTWHTNTWSTEGNTDGSKFLTPFHELWVASGNKLADATIKGSFTPTETGVYKVSAWVRAMNEAGGAVTGAKIFVGDAEADACSGSVVYSGKGRLGTYTAMADGESGTPFEYGFKIENAEINWLAFKNVTITYLGSIPQEEIDALLDLVPTGVMNASVQSTLNDLVSDFQKNASVANYNALSLYLPTAEASIAAYTDINTAISNYATKAAALDNTGAAAYDASGVQTKYDNGTYETLAEAEAELATAYSTAVKAQTTVGSDWTGLIVNPSFESDINTGWTSNMARQSNTSFAKTGTYYAEKWQPNGTFGVTQTISAMPSGVYRLSAHAKARKVTSAKLYAAGIDQAITIADSDADYNVEFACDADANIEIGFEGVGTGETDSWLCVDNFQLTLVSAGLPDVTAVTGKMNADVAQSQSDAIAAYNSEKTVANYNAASAAIAAAQSSKDAYTAANTALTKANEVLSNTNLYTSEAYNTFKGLVDDAQNGYENGTLNTNEANALNGTLFGTGWHSTAAVDDFLISAWDVNARDWSSYHVNTWSTTNDSGNPNFVVPCIEYWTGEASTLSDKVLTATLPEFTPGAEYKVTATICLGVNTGVDASTEPTGITLQLNDGNATACSGTHIPETRFYESEYEATGLIGTDGKLNIIINVSSTNVSWMTFRNVKYEKKADAAAPTTAQLDDLDAAINDVKNNVAGFETGEYAPYNNIDAFAALATAQSVDRLSQLAVTTATTALTGATWKVNTTEMNAFYDGTFANQDENTNPPTSLVGWNNPEGLRQLIKNTENYPGLNSTTDKAAVFAWGNTTLTYGNTEGYTMPLAAHTIYELTFKTCGWSDGDMGYVNVTVLNDNNEGMTQQTSAIATKRIGEENPWNEFKMVFATGDAGNYKFGMWTSKHTVFTDLEIKKAASQVLELAENTELPNYAPGTYPTVTITRTIKKGFNTLVLPFSMTQAEVEDVFGKDSKVYVVSSYDEDKKNISFDINDGINANKPCLLKATEASNGDYTLENRTIVAGEPVANGDKVSMTGTYKTIYVPVGNYIISGDMIYEVDSDEVTLRGTRAYITIDNANGARTLTMSFDDTATGIATLKDGKLEFETGDIYDLSGRKVKNPTKGIYLMNGKKVIK